MMKLNKPQFAIISDLHLGVHSNNARWHTIAVTWAEWLKSELQSKGITDIVFCGDWHHNRSEISVSTLQISADILEVLKDFNIILIVGNHDIFYKHRTDVNSISIFKGRSNLTIIDKVTTLTAYNRDITFCPWNTSASDIEKCDIIFGHFEIESFKMNTFKICEEGLHVPDLLARSPLVISGHFHLRHEKTFKEGKILYCGNPFQMDFGDANNVKGYYIMDLNDMSYKFSENTISPHYIKISLSELIRHKKITKEVKAIFKNNIVKLKIDKNIAAADLNILTTRLNQLEPESLILDYDVSYNKISEYEGETDLSGVDIKCAINEFVGMLDIDNKSDVLSYTIDLYNRCIS